MNVTNDEIRNIIIDYYQENHPDYCMTKRIVDRMIPILTEGLEKAPEQMTVEEAMPSLKAFLNKESVKHFIEERQPNTDPVPEQVIYALKAYFKEFLPTYEICKVYRHSNHPEDRFLYMVTAKTQNDVYTCWSSYHAGRDALNNGHYGLSSEESAIKILEELFTDITDEPEKYGMQVNYYENQQQSMFQAEQAANEEVVINRHRHR